MQILALKNLDPAELINLNKKTDGSCSNTSENSSDVNIEISRTLPAMNSLANITSRSSARPAEIQTQKADYYHHHLPQTTVKEESFRDMLCGTENHSEYWPWLE